MAVDLVFRYPAAAGTAVGNLDLRFVNLSGTPIVSATLDGTNQGIPDQYDLTFNVNGGVTVDVVCASSPKNPYETTGVAVTADGVTPNYGIVPEAAIVVSALVADQDQARVTMGAYMTALAAVTDILNMGIVEANSISTEQRIAAVNTGADDAAETDIIALPGLYWTPSSARSIVQEIDNHSSESRQRLATSGTKTITFANWGDDPGGSGKKKADVYVGGQLCIESALFDGETRYEYGVTGYVNASDLLRGLSIILRDTTTDPTAITISLIVDALSYQWLELAPDLSGAAGDWTSDAVTLTEDGQNAGIVRAGQLAHFWSRWNLPASASLGAIRLISLRARGEAI